MHLTTTNGEHCSGDGLKMAMRVGADAVDLEWVQVHPTGLYYVRMYVRTQYVRT